jgi:hypothetical protein
MQGGLQAQRGYSTSIRPSAVGLLLNVNTTTGAFLPPMLIFDFIAHMNGDQYYVEKLLRKCMLKITYDRKNHNNSDTDLNAEGSRLKTFQAFGLSVNEQKFYKKIETQSEEGRKVYNADPKDNGTTVLDYYIKGTMEENSDSPDSN